ncbi:dipeptidyl-peptidase 3 family protein [Salibacter halophilus]|uniref:Dihydrofolate reductase n=1 Tax=Salibacter halophilus TaxID=1803916 RepID=A0A6N6M695_9FLAO|nr:dihydrofolate reductase [Salibacter halophilus]KAB1065241.1 dihydrofolate reductase [Salibacter halophilus]
MNWIKYTVLATTATIAFSCGAPTEKKETKDKKAETVKQDTSDFEYLAEQFADLRIIRYQIPGWDKLSAQQKEYAYYLTQAGYAGRDIIWDQNYRHNLEIRDVLEGIVKNYNGDKESEDWKNFMTYTKRVWFSNGIHHHYSMKKFVPKFSREYFEQLMKITGAELPEEALKAMFDPSKDAKKVNLDPEKDLVAASAVNFYDPDLTEKEVENYYKQKIDKSAKKPVSYGLNSKLVKTEDGKIEERVWKIDGMYGSAIKEIVHWLEKAVKVAENQKQADALKLLIEYYKTGDLKKWDEYNIAWVNATEGDIDYINSFIEVYNDPMGYRGSYETIVQVKDFEASERMKTLSDNVQWFEDNSPIMDEHKKENVTGVTYKVVNVAGESGDASPSTPIGVNLPNSNWIRATHGSKSVSLGNIVEAYDKSSKGGYLKEFAYSQEEIDRGLKYGNLSDKLHTALHEVVGHASGKLNEGVGTPKETLKNYASTLEEARADLVALYYLYDKKMVDLGLMDNLEVGKAQYDAYIRNGLMVQLRRLEPGDNIEEAHMRNRQLVALWAYEKGKKDNVIEKKTKDGNTYFVVNDYKKLQELFGQLMREIQRIKSEGDYEAGRALVENYGVKVDKEIHEEVLSRSEELGIAPYGGFINPRLMPVEENGKIVDVEAKYGESFTEQMLRYSSDYDNL